VLQQTLSGEDLIMKDLRSLTPRNLKANSQSWPPALFQFLVCGANRNQ